MTVITALSGVSRGAARPSCRPGNPSPGRSPAPARGAWNEAQGVLALARTRTSARATGEGFLSSTSRHELSARRPRKRDLTAERTAYWVEQMQTAPDGQAALKDMWSWALGAIRQLEERRGPEAAEAARYHLARIVALFAAQSREALFELRPGLTDAEAAILFDPWNKIQGASQ